MAKSKTVHGKGSNLFCCNLGNLIAKSREHHFVLWSTTTKHHKLLVTRERKRYFDRRERNELRESVLLFLHHQMMQRVLLKSRWKEKIVRWIKDSIFCNERRPNVLSMAHYTMKVNEDLLCPTVIECTNIHFVIFFFSFFTLVTTAIVAAAMPQVDLCFSILSPPRPRDVVSRFVCRLAIRWNCLSSSFQQKIKMKNKTHTHKAIKTRTNGKSSFHRQSEAKHSWRKSREK